LPGRREFVVELAATALPTDCKEGPEAIAAALEDLTERDLWRYARALWAPVERARRLIGASRPDSGPSPTARRAFKP